MRGRVVIEELKVSSQPEYDLPVAGLTDVVRRDDLGLATPYAEPVSERQSALAGMFRDLLCIDRAGLHDDFFELGGDSMSGTILLLDIQQSFDVSLPIEILFEGATVAVLDRRIADLAARG